MHASLSIAYSQQYTRLHTKAYMSLVCLLTTTILPHGRLNVVYINCVYYGRSIRSDPFEFQVQHPPPAAEAWTFAISMNLIMRSRPLGVLVQHDSSFWNAITGALQSIPAALPSWITCQALLLTTSVLIEGAHSKKRGQWLVPCR